MTASLRGHSANLILQWFVSGWMHAASANQNQPHSVNCSMPVATTSIAVRISLSVVIFHVEKGRVRHAQSCDIGPLESTREILLESVRTIESNGSLKRRHLACAEPRHGEYQLAERRYASPFTSTGNPRACQSETLSCRRNAANPRDLRISTASMASTQ